VRKNFMLFKALVEYFDRIRKVTKRNEKIGIILEFLSKLKKEEAEIGINFIAGKIRQGRLNLAWKGLAELIETPTVALNNNLQLYEIDKYLEHSIQARGQDKIKVLYPLFSQLGILEKKYLASLIIGDVQQGVAEGLVKMAIAKFFNLKDRDVERAYMYKPDIGGLFAYLLEHGKNGIKDLGIKIFYPVKPMLAEIAESLDNIYDAYDDFAIEHKLDGIRIQVHRKGDEVRIFSRHLKDITTHFPELLHIAQTLSVNEFILDGEAIGVGENGRPVPFQILARRTTRKKDIDVIKDKIPVVPKFFDILYFHGEDLTPKDYTERWAILNDIIKKENYLAQRKIPDNKNDAIEFFQNSVNNRNEGIMVKLLKSPYQAGKRGNFWFKIKQAHTIDCVILAAEWGHGRRKGWLSNLHLGVLNETKTKFLMVGKTFKGLTDDMLIWFTENLPKFKVYEDNWIVYVKPEVVVEVAFNEVQISPKYDSGFALRFARVKRIRQDKNPLEINTLLDLEKLATSFTSSPLL